MQQVLAVIPARYASVRLPGKPLALIQNKPMIQWVVERTRRAKRVHDVVVATDDLRIVEAVEKFGGKAIMTSSEIQSGTDRIAAVADKMRADVYVNVQGDEPLIDPDAVDVAVELVTSGRFGLSTVMTPFQNANDLFEASIVKVLADKNDRAIYFSRHPIPYSRKPKPLAGEPIACFQHVGLYVYSREILFKFRELPQSPWELGESLEQLRALHHGIAIGIKEVNFTSIAIDTPEDLTKINHYLKERGIYG